MRTSLNKASAACVRMKTIKDRYVISLREVSKLVHLLPSQVFKYASSLV